MTEKKDTSLKHINENINLEDYLFKNLAQIYKLTSLELNDIKYLNNCIENWFNNNTFNLMSLKSKAEQTAVKSLLLILYSKIEHKLEYKNSLLIRVALRFIVDWKLFNMHHNTENSKIKKRDFFFTHIFWTLKRLKIHKLSVTSIIKSVSVAVNVEDFAIWAQAI